jgi:hypothetical protein
MASSLTSPCQCEHDSHFSSGSPAVDHSCHEYMQEFISGEVKPIKTIYGTFQMCKQCANDLPETMRASE